MNDTPAAKVCPREPTEAMLSVADEMNPPFGAPEHLTSEYCDRWRARTRRAALIQWQTMYDAAPTPPAAPDVAELPDGRVPIWWLPWAPQEVARRFHLAYEQFAPAFGYETRPDTKVFDPYSPNGQLMIAVVRNVLIEQASNHVSDYTRLAADLARVERELDEAMAIVKECREPVEQWLNRLPADDIARPTLERLHAAIDAARGG